MFPGGCVAERDASPALLAVERITREESARVVASLIRACDGDFQLAEDAFQEALIAAVQHWPATGTPRDPVAWIYTTARRKAIDQLRRARTAARTREVLGRELAIQSSSGRDDEFPDDDHGHDLGPIADDRLRLIFTCCHPALALETQVALTLKTIARLETGEIAKAFLVSEATMAQRIVRAKRKIRDARIPYAIPRQEHLEKRLSGVLTVLYLIFNEGYEATAGDLLLRPELCSEAVRLARLVAELLPGTPEAEGLLALMLLHDARRAARIDADGDMVTLEYQDRGVWDRAQIGEGIALVETALRRRRPGPFQIQAAIAALHAEPATAAETDWPQIALLYRELAQYLPNPIVDLNYAAAVGMAEGPDAGLRLLTDLERDQTLTGYHLFYAARADLLRRAGRDADAHVAYQQALRQCRNRVEARFLERRLAETAPGCEELR